jgi:hypothetical protein
MLTLSRFVPVLMRASYRAHGVTPIMKTTWVQWRGRIYFHRTHVG